MKPVATLLVFTTLVFSAKGQIESSGTFSAEIISADSLLFDVGFNKCNTEILNELISDDFSFYHDQAGITHSKQAFIESVKNGLCNLPYKAIRVLDKHSTAIFPLNENDSLYGAIQNGEHSFYALEDFNQKYLTSVAKFTHVWVLENERWKLKSVLSYDHKDVEKKNSQKGLFIDTQVTNRWLSEKKIPSVAIGFIDQGQIAQTSVFGEISPGNPAPLNTIWNVASLTKPITAMIALKMVNDGLWDLDESISKVYTDPDLQDDYRYSELTTRIILSHQTGLPNWRGDDGILKFDFDPGDRYQYSGEAYDLLRRALEAKFNKSIQALAEELIFEPLDMTSTSYIWSEEIDNKQFAQWHDSEGRLYELDKFYKASGADNLLTTIEDYSKFVLHVLRGAGLSDELREEMVADQVRVSDFKHFGLGWWIDENINQNKDYALVHGGDDIGVHCITFILPNSQKGLVMFTNSDLGTAAYVEIVNHYLEKDAEGIFNAEMN